VRRGAESANRGKEKAGKEKTVKKETIHPRREHKGDSIIVTSHECGGTRAARSEGCEGIVKKWGFHMIFC